MRLRQRISGVLLRRDERLRNEDVATLLRRMRARQNRVSRHDPSPNRGYATPFDGGQYPGVNPGGPF